MCASRTSYVSLTTFFIYISTVSRIKAHGERIDNVLLDVATDIYPMNEGESFSMVLASTLNSDGTEDTGHEHYTLQVINYPCHEICITFVTFNDFD